MRKIVALFLCLYFISANAQTNYSLVNVASENVYVASTMEAYNLLASNKRDRITREIKLPGGTVAYTFRITVASNESRPASSLAEEVSKIGIPTLMAVGFVAKLATSSDGSYADVYIFDNWKDANKFTNKEEGWWGCKAYKQTTSTNRTGTECLDMVAFGFRNNNGEQGVNIFFELIAIVDEAKKNYSQKTYDGMYDFCIKNPEISKVAGDKLSAYCNCFAGKMANEPSITNNDNSADAETIAKDKLASCLVDLNLVSKREMKSELFDNEIEQLEANGGKTAVIQFCEDKIAEGATDDFIFNCLGWNCLLTKQLTKAAYYLKTASEKYPLNLYISGNYAHALLLTGKYDEAMQIYKAHVNENVDENLSWKEAVTEDIKQFKKQGINHERFEELLQLMQ